MDYYQWMLDYTGDSLRGVTRRLGIKGASNLGKQARIYLSADRVIEIANAYGKDPIEALRQTEHINPAGESTDKTVVQLIDEAIDTLQSAKAKTADSGPETGHVDQSRYSLVADTSPEETEEEVDWTDPENIP